MKSYDVVGYAYDAAIHCVDCAEKAGMLRDGATDSECNEAHPYFADEWEEGETCDTCQEELA